SSRRRHTRWPRDWSSDVCSSDLPVRTYRVRLDGVPRRLARDLGPLRRLVPGSLAAILVVVMGIWWLRPDQPTITRAAVAVLPFEIGRASCRERVESWGGVVDGRE